MTSGKRLLLPLVFAFNAALTLLGFLALLDTTYTGLHMGVREGRALVSRVDQGSPADGLVRPGDEVQSVAGLKLPSATFHEDPDYIRKAADLQEFWRWRRALDGALENEPAVELSLLREGATSVVSLRPVAFPLGEAFARAAPIYLVGWIFFLVAFLVRRKNASEAASVFLAVGALVCTDWAAGTPFTVRDVAFSSTAFRLLTRLDVVSALFLVASFVHLALVFPRRILPPRLHASAVPALYGAAALLLALRFAGWLQDTYLTSYLAFTSSLAVVMALYLAQYLLAGSTLVRRQIQWVVLATVLSSGLYVGASALPAILGVPFVSVALSGFAFVVIPLSFAFAITKYRLMDIEGIVDTTIVYGFTIAVLAALELALLGLVSPHVTIGAGGLPVLSVAAVLLIVFVYVPVRDQMRGVVERLFRRGTYNVERELQRFGLMLSRGDGRSGLDEFASFVDGLLKPSGMVVIAVEEGVASFRRADTERARAVVEQLLRLAPVAWEELSRTRRCSFGFALSLARKPGEPPLPRDVEEALFVPFVADPGKSRSGPIAVLLPKWSRTSYGAKDAALLDAAALHVGSLLAADELRRERRELEERYRREKEEVMRELHDGLGGLLTGLNVTSQATEKVIDRDVTQAKELVRRIGEYSAEAVQFMRTGLAILDTPGGELGTLLESVRERQFELLASEGVELRIEYPEDVGRLRLSGIVALNLLRTLQEALHNVLKHAQAQRVIVRVERRGGDLAVTVLDDGKGFEPSPDSAGHGLGNLRSRAQALDGTLRIASTSERGTQLELTIPLPLDAKGAAA